MCAYFFSFDIASARWRAPTLGKGVVLLLVLLAASAAVAQAPHTARAFNAAYPDAPTAPLQYAAPEATLPGLAQLPTPQGWKDANSAVGQFPRGHADIVRWEARHNDYPHATQPAGQSAVAAESAPDHRQPSRHGHHVAPLSHRAPHATRGGKP